MATTPSALLAAICTLALGLAACGGDDQPTTSSTAATAPPGVVTTGATGTEGADVLPVTADSAEDAVKTITGCLEDADHQVLKNPSSVGGAKYFLVVDAGVAGVIYVFDDAAAASSGQKAAGHEEGGTDRTTEQAGQTVIAYSQPGSSQLAGSETDVADLKRCTGAT